MSLIESPLAVEQSIVPHDATILYLASPVAEIPTLTSIQEFYYHLYLLSLATYTLLTFIIPGPIFSSPYG